MEQRKLEVANLKAELCQAAASAEQLAVCQEALRIKEQQEKSFQQQLATLTDSITDR